MTIQYALRRAAAAKAKGNDFGAMFSLIVRDIIGDRWLRVPFTAAEQKRRMTQYSDYGSRYWTTEPKGAYGAVRCYECNQKVKKKYPWFPTKECRDHLKCAI